MASHASNNPPIGGDSIDRPIFVIGTGRSGTSLLFTLLGLHPDLAWFSNYGNRFYRWTWPALLSRACDLPGIDVLLAPDRRFIPKPSEPYGILNEITAGLFTADRRLDASDATPEIQARFRARVDSVLRLHGKSRFAHKHTGFARTRFLDAIFPSARFIDVYRDGRAAAVSLSRVGWWKGLASWRWGPMRPEYEEEYLRSGRNRLVLAAISWKTLMDEIEDECRDLPAERIHRLRYEDLIAGVRPVLEGVLRFSELRDAPRYWRRVERYEVHDRESRWRGDIAAVDRDLIEQCLYPHLQKYGFEA